MLGLCELWIGSKIFLIAHWVLTSSSALSTVFIDIRLGGWPMSRKIRSFFPTPKSCESVSHASQRKGAQSHLLLSDCLDTRICRGRLFHPWAALRCHRFKNR